MSVLKRFSQSGLLPKAYMAIAFTGFTIFTYKMWLGPYVRKRSYKEAEAWAKMIIDQEERELTRE